MLSSEFDFVIEVQALDRKSTRLNSSHLVISYAVFCLKKKNQSLIAHLRVLLPPQPSALLSFRLPDLAESLRSPCTLHSPAARIAPTSRRDLVNAPLLP